MAVFTWDQINELRAKGIEALARKESKVTPFEVEVQGVKYSFLDCWNGVLDLNSDYYDNDKTPIVVGDPFNRTEQRLKDEEEICSLLVCNTGTIVYNNKVFYGEFPVSTMCRQFKKDDEELKTILDSMCKSEKEVKIITKN